ncbi:MAG: hypothetical protein ACTH31_13440, partial [Pseudoclavibacter sp.]
GGSGRDAGERTVASDYVGGGRMDQIIRRSLAIAGAVALAATMAACSPGAGHEGGDGAATGMDAPESQTSDGAGGDGASGAEDTARPEPARPLYADTLVTGDTDYEAVRRLTEELDAAASAVERVSLALLFVRYDPSGDVNELADGTAITMLTKDGSVSVQAAPEFVEKIEGGWIELAGQFSVSFEDVDGAGPTYVLSEGGHLADDADVPAGDDERCNDPALDQDVTTWAQALAEYDLWDPVELYDDASATWSDAPYVWGAVKASALTYRASGFEVLGDHVSQACVDYW